MAKLFKLIVAFCKHWYGKLTVGVAVTGLAATVKLIADIRKSLAEGTKAKEELRTLRRKNDVARVKHKILEMAGDKNTAFFYPESARIRWIELLRDEDEGVVLDALRELQREKDASDSQGWR